jgi:hypothetical protein
MNHKALLALIIPLILFGSVFAQEFPPYMKELFFNSDWAYMFSEALSEYPPRFGYWFADISQYPFVENLILHSIVVETTPYGELNVYHSRTLTLNYTINPEVPFRVLYREGVYPNEAFLLLEGDENMCYIYLIRVNIETGEQIPHVFGPFSPCYNIFYDSYSTGNDFILAVVLNHVPDGHTNYYNATAIILWQDAVNFENYAISQFTLDPSIYPELSYYEDFSAYWLSVFVLNNTHIYIIPSFYREDTNTIDIYIPEIFINSSMGYVNQTSLSFVRQSTYERLLLNIGKLTLLSHGIEFGIPSILGIPLPLDYGGYANIYSVFRMLEREYNISVSPEEIREYIYNYVTLFLKESEHQK